MLARAALTVPRTNPHHSTGLGWRFVPGVPSWLETSEPQHVIEPSSVRAQEWLVPAVTCLARIPGIVCGIGTGDGNAGATWP